MRHTAMKTAKANIKLAIASTNAVNFFIILNWINEKISPSNLPQFLLYVPHAVKLSEWAFGHDLAVPNLWNHIICGRTKNFGEDINSSLPAN